MGIEEPLSTSFCFPAGAIFVFLLLLSQISRADAPKNAAPPPAVDPAFYAYDQAAPFPVTEKPYGVENGVQITTITYPSLVQTPYAVNNTVTAYLFMPPGLGPAPCHSRAA